MLRGVAKRHERLCEKPRLRVIPRSRRRRGIWHCLENIHSEIPRPDGIGASSARNDSLSRVTTQTPGERAVHLVLTPGVQPLT